MNKKIEYLFLIAFSGTMFSPLRIQAQRAGETVSLFTDRNIYISGEMVRFAAFMHQEGGQAGEPGSQVLYAEIITAEGIKIATGKFPLIDNKSNGFLQFPDEIFSGNYYLRAYTRQMRNAGPSSYPAIALKLVNPFKTEMLGINNTMPVDSIKHDIPVENKTGGLTLATERTSYARREKISLQLKNEGPGMPVTGLCLTVVPEASVYVTETVPIQNNFQPDYGSPEPQFFKETKGISITGRLVEKETTKPVPNVLITLSIIGDKDFSAFKTDMEGRFSFVLPPYVGTKDIFISADEKEGKSTTILIDNDFCTMPVKLPMSRFILNETEKRMVLDMSVNYQVSQQYYHAENKGKDTASLVNMPFYGQPTATLIIGKYIELPTLDEYFQEIPLEVKIRESKGRKYFKFISSGAEMIVNDPLVLIDGVAVGNMEKILAISPQKIARIEIVNKPYVKGNITFGGIISIISVQGDFAGIDLPSSGIFVGYHFYSPVSREEQIDTVKDNRPDFRNTLLWMPDLNAGRGEVTSVAFTAPDTPGKYIALLRGVDQSGIIVRQGITFTVTGK